MRWMKLCLVAVAACSSSSQHSATPTQAATFDQTALAASAAVGQYQGAAAGATNQTECMAALQHYVNAMQPLLEQMRSLASPMDAFMKQAGNMMAGDMECGVQVMADELAHHQAVACANSDMAANQSEARRDVDAMMSFADHMQMRSVQAGGMMGGQDQRMDAGWMMGWSDAGWTMPDGGMVTFGQPIPGCTYGDGGYEAPDAGYWMDGGWVMDGGMGGGMMDGGTMTDGGTMMDGGMTGGGMR